MAMKHQNILAAAFALFAAAAFAQDSPSLGDLARQQRQQKEQSKEQSKDAKPAKVITNADLPERSAPAPSAAVVSGSGAERNSTPSVAEGAKGAGEHWRSDILAQKHQIDSLQRQVDELSESVRFAPANCASGCVGWNERQREKQQRVERMQAQLEEEKRRLDEMQDSARKQGFGSSIYDP